ncbi:MAG: amidohydrolase family protein [Firmicutes bacterium]|nr:amidohydrolase family protein [Bacillota bacterium]
MSKLLLHGAWVVTEKDDQQGIIEDGYVGVIDDKIAYVGKEKPVGYEDAEFIDRKYGLIIPGLIDTHYHSDSPATKGFCEDVGSPGLYGSILYEYLTAIYAVCGTEEWRPIANLTFMEFLKGGVTTCVEFNAYFPEDIAYLIRDCGIRGYVGPETNTLDKFPYSPDGHTLIIPHKEGPDMFKKLERNVDLIEKYNGKFCDRVTMTLGPTEPPACRPEMLREVRKLADKYKLPITIHAAETMIEREYIQREYGMDSIEWLMENGICGPDVIYAHTPYCSEKEKLLMAETKTNVAHCPSIFLSRGKYMKSLQKYTDLGINVSIGTDTFPQDMIREMRLASSMSKVADDIWTSAPAGLVFKCATKNGAKALGRDDLGKLVVGAKADIAIVDMNDFNTLPVRDPIRVLVSCTTSHNVTDTIVDGKVIMKNKQLLTMDEEKVKAEAWEAQKRMWSRIENLNELSPLSVPFFE